MQSKTLLSLLAVTGAFLHGEMASGQALPPSVRTPQADKTLGTQVSGNGNNFTVTGGLNRGQTLFHSFKDFSIPTGGAANFNNPVGTRDIITRVTGNLFSDLNGTLNSNGANFLLINPNGVVFGPNARLNVGKAFAASTASGVDLIDGQGRQITFGTKPGGDAPLLKINPNVFLNISRLNMGASVPKNPGIVNYGKLQTNNDSQYIGLIGGNVTLDGKYGGGKIIAPGGRVDLGGLNSAGTVSTDAQGLVFGGNGLVRSDVLLDNAASVNTPANKTLGTVKPFFSDQAVAGSNININANNLNILKKPKDAASLSAGLGINSGIKTLPAGDININATGRVSLDNADIRNTIRPGAEGKIGDININANSLSLINNSDISTNNTFGKGDAGDININANSLSLINSSDISTSNTLGKGDAGNINVKTTGDISIVGTTPQSTQVTTLKSNDSSISSDTNGQGNTGKITIDTQNRGKLLLLNGGNIASRIGPTGVGKGNDIKILAQAIDLTNGSSIITDNISKVDVKGNENKKIAQDLGFTDFLSKIGADNVGGKGDAGNIDIKTTGDIRISSSNPQFDLDLDRQITAKSILSSPLSSSISSNTNGQGNAGGITIDTQNRGKLSLFGGGTISSGIGKNAVGKGNGIKISAQAVDLIDGGTISTSNAGGKGDAGNIRIDTIGDISLLSSLPRSTNIKFFSAINTDTFGQGNAGKITIDTQNRGKLSLSNGASISSGIVRNAVGDGGGIAISAREIDLQNQSYISTSNGGGKGDAGSIDLKTTGDINIFGSIPGSTGLMTQNSNLSFISSNTSGQGKAGKITIDTQDRGKLLLDRGFIFSTIDDSKAVSNGGDVTISAREIDLRNRSFISSGNFGGKGDAGNIDIKTIGNISLFDANITSSTTGQGKAGNITIDTQDRGKLSLDRAEIASTIEGQKAVGNGGKIAISAREIDLRNRSFIDSSNVGGKGDAGNIDIKTIGDINISGSTPESTAPITSTSDLSRISSFTNGQGNAGKITIDTQNRGKLSLSNRSFITNEISERAVGNSPGISISARELDLRNQSFINSTNFGGIGDVGNIKIDTTGAVEITNVSAISSTNLGQGKTGDISLNIDRITLNSGIIQAESLGGAGGNIQLTTSDLLLLRNSSDISTRSGSNGKNGNGGNITINSPLIIALPAGNNDINANAVGGNGGRVDIVSKGLFGIQFRPRLSNLTNDITASSTFGQSGTVNISTPGTDPGKDSTQLPNVPTDASNQIAQACGASRENKFIVAGRGGLPSNANDPLTSDVVWQDARGANSQPTASSATTDPTKLAPPATGLVFDGKGKATLIAAGTQGQPTGTSVVCPSVVRK